ncbi:MAG TPA: AarF/UbiB family protein [Jatrophihabitantaceae bacterium]|nr:AarF/UbiB family protein [Jatrophihabitantaceae bacterium]
MVAFDVTWAIVMFMALRTLAARLLAVRIGPIGAGLAAALAVAGGIGAQHAIAAGTGSSPGREAAAYLVFAGLSLLITMTAVATLGLLSGPAATPNRVLSGIPHPLRQLRARVDRSRRYVGLLWLGARHGLGPLSGLRRSRDPGHIGVALRDALSEAGGIFVKFGQQLSAHTDLVPSAIAMELTALQDDVPTLPSHVIRSLIEAELGSPPETIFAEFDEAALAAASIAQVHRARLRTGEPVIVKAQRPGIERLVARDLDILLRLADSLEVRARWARRIGSVALAEGFARNVSEELDFRIEARNIRALADGSIRVPRVYPLLTTRRLLVEEWVEGDALRAADGLLDQRDRTKLARRLFDGMLDQILRIGVFHADPHAGNVLIARSGEPVLLDFGSVGRLDRTQRRALTQALAAVALGRAAVLSDALLDLAAGRAEVDVDGLERALDRLLSRTLGAEAGPAVQTLTDIVDVIAQFGLTLDPQLAGVFRALATLDGTLRLIDPAFDMIAEARRYASEAHLGLPTSSQLGGDIAGDILELLPALRNLPRRADRISRALERGDFSLKLRTLADPRDVAVIGRYVNRFVLAFISASIGLVSALLLGVAGGPVVFGTRLDLLLGYLGLAGATALGLRVVVAITRDGG